MISQANEANSWKKANSFFMRVCVSNAYYYELGDQAKSNGENGNRTNGRASETPIKTNKTNETNEIQHKLFNSMPDHHVYR